MTFTSSEGAAVFGAPAPRYPVEALGRRPGCVLEVGAGSGGGTRVLLDALPGVPVTAIEPDDAARNALVWHLAATGAVSECLTVLPLHLDRTPGRFDLVVGHHVVCQLPVADRPAFWRDVREHLLDDGLALFDAHLGAAAATAVPRRLSAEATFGACTYRRWFTAEPVPEGLSLLNEYEVLDAAGAVLHREERRSLTEVLDEDAGLAMITEAGLRIRRLDGWFALSRS